MAVNPFPSKPAISSLTMTLICGPDGALKLSTDSWCLQPCWTKPLPGNRLWVNEINNSGCWCRNKHRLFRTPSRGTQSSKGQEKTWPFLNIQDKRGQTDVNLFIPTKKKKKKNQSNNRRQLMSHSKNKYMWQDQHQEILGVCQTQGSISINTIMDAARGQRGIWGSAEYFTLMGGGWEL